MVGVCGSLQFYFKVCGGIVYYVYGVVCDFARVRVSDRCEFWGVSGSRLEAGRYFESMVVVLGAVVVSKVFCSS